MKPTQGTIVLIHTHNQSGVKFPWENKIRTGCLMAASRRKSFISYWKSKGYDIKEVTPGGLLPF